MPKNSHQKLSHKKASPSPTQHNWSKGGRAGCFFIKLGQQVLNPKAHIGPVIEGGKVGLAFGCWPIVDEIGIGC